MGDADSTLVVGVLTLLLFAASGPLAKISKAGNPPVSVLPFALLGSVLARRQPRNPIGWIMLLLGPAFIVGTRNTQANTRCWPTRSTGAACGLQRLAVVRARLGLAAGRIAVADPAVSRRPNHIGAVAFHTLQGIPGRSRRYGSAPLSCWDHGSDAASREARRGNRRISSMRRGAAALRQRFKV